MNKQFFISVCLLMSLVAMVSLSIPAQSATVAYWRFNTGPVNTNVLHAGATGYTFSPDTQDVSGNGNHLAVWGSGGGAGYAYRATTAFSTMPQTGQANPFSVQNTGGSPAMYTRSSQGHPTGIDVEAIAPAQWTVEAFFKPEASGSHRTLVGRDARYISTEAGDRAAMYFKIEPNDTVSIAFVDAAGFWHAAGSPETIKIQGFSFGSDPTGATGRWYYMAAVSDGKTLSLYLANVTAGTGLQLVAQTDMTVSGSPNTALNRGGTTNGGDWHAGGWSVGRGMWAGAHADRAWGFIDEVRISNHAVEPKHFLYSPRVNAWNPTPADSALAVGTPNGEKVNVALSWNTGMSAADLTQVNTAIGKHYLYMSEDQRTSSDPNLVFKAEIAATGATGQTTVLDLEFNGEYLWRIDESINGSLPSDPNTIKGPLWAFNTLLSVPVITLDPVSQLVDPGQTVDFTIAAASVSSITYKWYKSADNANDTIDDDTLVGGNSATLTLTNVQVANEGFYYCVVSNPDSATDTSNPASLEIKQLKAWYAFENAITDSAGINHGTAIKADPNIAFTYVDGMTGKAIVFNGVEEAVQVPRSIQDSFTIKLWVKTAATGGTGGWWNGRGLVDGEMPGGVNDFGTVLLGSKFGFGVGVPDTTIASTTNINNNEWHFCVATRDHLTGRMRVYVDGLQEASATGGTGRKDASTALRMGSLLTGNNFLAGQLDEVKLYNYVVDALSIATEYTGLTGESVCFDRPAYDYTGDCRVTMDDFALFAAQWLDCAVVPDCLP
jgi:hypothetical protein